MGRAERKRRRARAAHRRRQWAWLRIGPGFVLAVALSLVILAQHGWRLRPEPVIERPTVQSARPMQTPPSDVGLVPEPAWLVRHAAEVGLTGEQLARARSVVADWERDTASERQEAATANDEMRGYLKEQRAQGAVRPADAMQHSQRLAALSANLAAQRHAAWGRLWAMLDAAQRDKVTALRRQAPAEMR